jgi:hypothetical protein
MLLILAADRVAATHDVHSSGIHRAEWGVFGSDSKSIADSCGDETAARTLKRRVGRGGMFGVAPRSVMAARTALLS